jgi:hypothetical protein
MNEVKLNLIYNKADFLNSHTNICPFNFIENPELVIGDTAQLDWIVDNGECSQIIALDTIEYIPHNKVYEVISNWTGKLKVGGQLILGFVEILECCNLYHRGNIKHDDFNSLIHGSQEKSHLIKLSSFSAPLLIENLTKQHTIKMMKHTLNGVDTCLVFERYR